jgi:N-methylhydantoinase A
VVHLAVDIGGTFTDVVAVDPATGRYHAVKVPTTPHNLVDGVRHGALTALARAGAAPADVSRFVHGTTIGTNAVLEQQGAVTGVIATDGFEDTLEIGRLKRSRIYDLFIDGETPVFLAPKRRRRGVRERIAADGSVIIPLDAASVIDAVRDLVANERVEAIAVCLLFSFRNRAHEHEIRRLIAEVDPSISVSLSCEVDPMFREYERTVVTAFDAYIRPVIRGYLGQLDAELAGAGITAPVQVMQSRGGITSAALMSRRPVSLLLSGPAAGVVGARYAGQLAGFHDVITIDVGGTSADVSLVQAGKPLVAGEGMIGTYPLRLPMVDVTTIGAGGGSIAWIDQGGSFRVGPRSAGAVPGPACYGAGGVEPTVTDASLVLGYLNAERFAGGTLRPDVDSAQRSLAGLGRRAGMPALEVAAGIHRVINSRMADAIRLVSIKRGYDPRDFALVLLGGAGPLHGGRLADALGIRTTIVPAVPGVLSALGLLVAGIEHDAAETVAIAAHAVRPSELEATFQRLEADVSDLMQRDHVPAGAAVTARSVDGRYAGQAYTLEVPMPAVTDAAAVRAFIDGFHAVHERVYGYADRKAAVELVNLRVVQSWSAGDVSFRGAAAGAEPAVPSSRRAYFEELGGYVDVPVRRREGLAPGASLAGPMLIDQDDTTVVIYPGHHGVVDASGTIVVTSATSPASDRSEMTA